MSDLRIFDSRSLPPGQYQPIQPIQPITAAPLFTPKPHNQFKQNRKTLIRQNYYNSNRKAVFSTFHKDNQGQNQSNSPECIKAKKEYSSNLFNLIARTSGRKSRAIPINHYNDDGNQDIIFEAGSSFLKMSSQEKLKSDQQQLQNLQNAQTPNYNSQQNLFVGGTVQGKSLKNQTQSSAYITPASSYRGQFRTPTLGTKSSFNRRSQLNLNEEVLKSTYKFHPQQSSFQNSTLQAHDQANSVPQQQLSNTCFRSQALKQSPNLNTQLAQQQQTRNGGSVKEHQSHLGLKSQSMNFSPRQSNDTSPCGQQQSQSQRQSQNNFYLKCFPTNSGFKQYVKMMEKQSSRQSQRQNRFQVEDPLQIKSCQPQGFISPLVIKTQRKNNPLQGLITSNQLIQKLKEEELRNSGRLQTSQGAQTVPGRPQSGQTDQYGDKVNGYDELNETEQNSPMLKRQTDSFASLGQVQVKVTKKGMFSDKFIRSSTRNLRQSGMSDLTEQAFNPEK